MMKELLVQRAFGHPTLIFETVHEQVDIEAPKLVERKRSTRRFQVVGTDLETSKQIRTATGLLFLIPRTVPEWNKLLDHSTSASSIEIFKSSILRGRLGVSDCH